MVPARPLPVPRLVYPSPAHSPPAYQEVLCLPFAACRHRRHAIGPAGKDATPLHQSFTGRAPYGISHTRDNALCGPHMANLNLWAWPRSSRSSRAEGFKAYPPIGRPWPSRASNNTVLHCRWFDVFRTQSRSHTDRDVLNAANSRRESRSAPGRGWLSTIRRRVLHVLC